jgi:hypothetical protein
MNNPNPIERFAYVCSTVEDIRSTWIEFVNCKHNIVIPLCGRFTSPIATDKTIAWCMNSNMSAKLHLQFGTGGAMVNAIGTVASRVTKKFVKECPRSYALSGFCFWN